MEARGGNKSVRRQSAEDHDISCLSGVHLNDGRHVVSIVANTGKQSNNQMKTISLDKNGSRE